MIPLNSKKPKEKCYIVKRYNVNDNTIRKILIESIDHFFGK